MSIRIRQDFYLVCTYCNNQYYSDRLKCFPEGDSVEALYDEAITDGWKILVKVENGSLWDFHPHCYEMSQMPAVAVKERDAKST